jgi:hypothetical protein
MSKYNSYSDFPSYEVNPFWGGGTKVQGLDIDYFRIYNHPTTEKQVYDKASGEESEVLEKVKGKHIYDSQPFLKVYKTFITDLKYLTSPAGLILWDMLERLGENSDEVRFNVSAFMHEYKYKGKSNIYKGLTELLRMNILAKKAGSDGYFFINIAKVYHGKRENHSIAKKLLNQIK